MFAQILQRCRPWGCRGCHGAMAPPDFGRSVNPVSTRGTDYAHLITTGTPGFSDLPTALYYTVLSGMPEYTYRDMGICPDNFLADTLTLFQPRGADYTHQSITCSWRNHQFTNLKYCKMSFKAFKMKEQNLICFLKQEVRNNTPLKRGF